jgi:hypothetical protein
VEEWLTPEKIARRADASKPASRPRSEYSQEESLRPLFDPPLPPPPGDVIDLMLPRKGEWLSEPSPEPNINIKIPPTSTLDEQREPSKQGEPLSCQRESSASPRAPPSPPLRRSKCVRFYNPKYEAGLVGLVTVQFGTYQDLFAHSSIPNMRLDSSDSSLLNSVLTKGCTFHQSQLQGALFQNRRHIFVISST